MSNLTASPPEAAVALRAAAPITLPPFRLNLMRGGFLLMAVASLS